MNRRVKIKVIKKDEMKIVETPEIIETIPEKENASKLASTVSDWINEFQERRREETASAIEQFSS
jgi:hypothetical protein